MIENVQTEYKAYVAAIETSKNCGTGFFIAPELICTCYHVIADSDMSDISVRWKDRILQVQDCSRYEDKDLVFLQTKDANNDGWLSFAPIDAVKEGMQFRAFGFPENHRDYGSPFLLTYTGADVNNQILSFSQDNITPGASGSPIVSSNTNSLLGMLSVSRDVQTPSGGRGLSANCILKCLCEDPKFYSYAIRMFQRNDAISIGDLKWSCDNQFIINALRKYLEETLINQKELFDYNVLMPYLLVSNLSHIENPYISIDYLLREKFIDYREAYRSWLQKHYSAGSNSYLSEAIEYVSTYIAPLPKECVANINRLCKRLRNMRIAGSSTLSLGSLMEPNSNLFVPYNIQIERKQRSDVSTECMESQLNSLFALDQNVLILSEPGGGKSTMMIASFFQFLSQRINNLSNIIPIYVNLQKEINTQQLSQAWLDLKIRNAYGKSLSEEYIGKKYSNIVLFLDGLDEFLSQHVSAKVNEFFDSPIFSTEVYLHVVLSCREQFYRRYIQYNDTVLSFCKIYLLKWSSQQKKQYITEYIRSFTDDNAECYESMCRSVQLVVQNNLFLNDLSNTPLYLNMCIEVLVNDSGHQITNLIDLFDRFTEYWINREFSKVCEIYPNDSFVDQVMEILPFINWKLYVQLGAKFTKTTICNIIKSFYEKNTRQDVSRYDQLVDFIVQHTFFVSDRKVTAHSNLSYVHKSFMEFFVSRYVFSCISAADGKPELILETHKNFLAHEISELLKEHFLQINNYNKGYQKQINRKCLNNCLQAVTHLPQNDSLNTSEKQLAQQQLIYHIGQIKLPETMAFLKRHLIHETNLWTRRTIILGLSFSGDETELTAYIKRMKDERASGGQALESAVNIGFSLSFFGDQSMDDLHPEVDQGLPQCKNTVSRLIQQLSASRNRPSWHNDLYTLVDLAENRPVSKQDYIDTIWENRTVLLKVLDDIENYDEQTSRWPEIQQMRRIISEICKVS